MADRPIIFSGPMVQALLAGWKTQTRRLVDSPLARVAAGDRLWVRENHYRTDDGESERAIPALDEAAVAAHREAVRRVAREQRLPDTWLRRHLLLRPSIHMPRWASRLTLHVTELRRERLHRITAADARAEGTRYPDRTEAWHEEDPRRYVGAFRLTWERLHGEAAWDDNPEVVALSFRVQPVGIGERGGQTA